MDLFGVVQWWEESRLRFLVLASLVIQYILLVASVARKFPIGSCFRPIMWLAYLGSDGIAIYSLAILFNRTRDVYSGGNYLLEVFWAPILLIHLGGQDGITAYNIEDNELWMRHIFTAVSQVTAAVYVFCKSWPGGDPNLLTAAILLFIAGTIKCFEKPLALSRASINSLVSSGQPVRRSVSSQKLKIDPLEDFIDKATSPTGETEYLLTAATAVDFTPFKLFVDLASPSSDDRIRMLQRFSSLDDNAAYCMLQGWLSHTFQFLYTREKLLPFSCGRLFSLTHVILATPFRSLPLSLTLSALVPFHFSYINAYNAADVKVTYALLCFTALLEVSSFFLAALTRVTRKDKVSRPERVKPFWVDKVSQYNLIGFLLRNKEHSIIMSIVGVLGCSNFLHQHWRIKSCSSSFNITKLVLEYVKDGWERHIRDVSSYRKFNDNRGQLTLLESECYQKLGWSIEGAFDESVLLWHLATDFCYYDMHSCHHGSQCTQDSCPHVYTCPAWCEGSGYHKRAVLCREMSNYMMHLLFVNPEMLMAGTRRNLFSDAYDELKAAIMDRDEPPVQELKRVNPPVEVMQCLRRLIPVLSCPQMKRQLSSQKRKEIEITQKIIVAVDCGESPPQDSQQGIIHDAWSIARSLSGLSEEKMWDVIEGVWVEMMCFSAARCRGYLHAKGLATGVEYLTYVWLLQYYMGMETLATKLQRVNHHYCNGGVLGGDRSTPCASREVTGQELDAGPSSSGATPQEKAADQWPYQAGGAIEEEMV